MTKKLWMGPLMLAVVAMAYQPFAESRPARVGQVPNGGLRSCSTCHSNPGGGPRNVFGQDVDVNMTEPGFAGVAIWADIADIDSDGDGFTNGEELGDPDGVWTPGDPDPEVESNPADPNSIPAGDPEPDMMPDPMPTPEPTPEPDPMPDPMPTPEPTPTPDPEPEGEPDPEPEGEPDGAVDDDADEDEGCATAPGQTDSTPLALLLVALGLTIARRKLD